jgi:hypothetical protein
MLLRDRDNWRNSAADSAPTRKAIAHATAQYWQIAKIDARMVGQNSTEEIAIQNSWRNPRKELADVAVAFRPNWSPRTQCDKQTRDRTT